MIYALALVAMFVGLGLQVWAFSRQQLDVARGCTCSKNAVDWRCPIHGSEANR